MSLARDLLVRIIYTGAIILTISLFCCMHKFYVSLTEIRIMADNNSVQISMRIFPDDLDNALEKIYGTNPQIATELEHEKADLWAEEYLREHLKIVIDETVLPIKYLGKEQEADAVWFFIESTYEGMPGEISINNSMLMDFYEDQKNIIQVYFGKINKSLLLSKNQASGSIDLSGTSGKRSMSD